MWCRELLHYRLCHVWKLPFSYFYSYETCTGKSYDKATSCIISLFFKNSGSLQYHLFDKLLFVQQRLPGQRLVHPHWVQFSTYILFYYELNCAKWIEKDLVIMDYTSKDKQICILHWVASQAWFYNLGNLVFDSKKKKKFQMHSILNTKNWISQEIVLWFHMRAMDFKTMLVTGLALWSIVQSVFTWYPLQNYFSFWSVVFLLIIGWFLLPFLDRERRKFSRQDIKCWRWRIEFRNWRNTTSKCWKNEAEQAIFEERTY